MKRYVLVILFLVDLLSIGFYMQIYFGHIFKYSCIFMSTEQASSVWNNVSVACDKDSQSNTSAIKPLLSMVIVKFLR